jgi:hypothetical protein
MIDTVRRRTAEVPADEIETDIAAAVAAIRTEARAQAGAGTQVRG